MSKICLNCGNEVDDDARFCSICGTPMNEQTSASNAPPEPPAPPEEPHCPSCGKIVAADASFCRYCGAALTETPASEPVSDAHGTQEVQNTSPRTDSTESDSASASSAVPSAAPSAATQSTSQGINWKAIGSTISTIITIIILIFVFTKHPVADTKAIVFNDWGTAEIGDAAERSLSDPEWSSSKIAKKQYYVTVSGYCRDYDCMLSITFETTYSGDHIYAQAVSCRWGTDTSTDAVSIALAMSAIYS